MLKRLSPREKFEVLLAEYEPIIRKAFLEAVADLRSGVAMRLVIERLERRDIEGAIQALNIDRAAYSPLDEAVRRAYSGGGNAIVNGMPALRDPNWANAVVRFDAQAYRAVEWLRRYSLAEPMVEIDKDVARTMMVEGLSRGRGARSIGLDIAGRINRTTGRREGGAIGLSRPQAEYVVSMRDRLASGDPAEMRKVFDMTRRDKRFDRTIEKAIREEKPIPATQLDRITGRYADRLLELRGTTIATDQGMASFNEAQMEAYRQAIDKGTVKEADLEKTWRSVGDMRVRDTHVAMDGQKVGFMASFVSPSGATLRYPHDPDAPAEERVNCFAPWSRIALTGICGAVAHRYSGELVELAIGDEIVLSVTPNHPVLTDRGWVAAGLVNEGYHLVQCLGHDEAAAFGAKPDVADMYARADEVYRAAHALGTYERASRSVVDFHGHVPDHDVDIVSVDVPLRVAIEPAVAKVLDSLGLAETDLAKGTALFDRICNLRDGRGPLGGLNGMRGQSAAHAIIRGHEGRAHAAAFGHGGAGYPEIFQAGVDYASRDAEFGCNAQDRVAVDEQLGDPIKVGLAFLAKAFGGVSGLVGREFGFRHVFHANVGEARNSNLTGDADLFGDGAGIQAALAKAAHAIMQMFAAPLPSLAVAVHSATGNAGIRDYALRSAVSNAVVERGLVDRGAGLVGGGDGGNHPFVPVKVTSTRRVHYDGLVYDFETDNGLILADNLISHNCRCRMDITIDFLARFRRRG